jgi:hypothetical protein
MPTGYTSPIYEGQEMSGEEFILRCARAFGATIMMRDEPLDKPIPEFEPSDYHIKQLNRAKSNMEKYKAMTFDELSKEVEEVYKANVDNYNKTLNDKHELFIRLNNTLREVEAWNPPTEEHKELKSYAIDQLKQTIEYDCSTKYLSEPVKLDPIEWFNEKIERCKKDIEYHTKEWNEEVKRTNNRNKWVKQLRDSLGGQQ